MPKYKLCYFNSAGFAELCRWVFAAAGEEYEDFRWEKKDWSKYKNESPTGKAPWLEIENGGKIAHSTAIARYLAKQFGLVGRTDLEEARVDMVCAISQDYATVLRPYFYEKEGSTKEMMKTSLMDEKLPEFFSMFQRLQSDNGNAHGYFVGDSLTLCDIQVTLALGFLDLVGMSSLLDNYPLLQRLMNRVKLNPGIKAWLEKRPI